MTCRCGKEMTQKITDTVNLKAWRCKDCHRVAISLLGMSPDWYVEEDKPLWKKTKK